jgi:hypothetical protein
VVKPKEWLSCKRSEALDWFLNYYPHMAAQLPPHQQVFLCFFMFELLKNYYPKYMAAHLHDLPVHRQEFFVC